MHFADLLIWGLCVHLFVDWFLQNQWQSDNKTNLEHPAAYVHSGLHFLGLLFVFHPPIAFWAGLTHLLIDTRKPLVWWRSLFGQTQVEWDDRIESRIVSIEQGELMLDVIDDGWAWGGYSIGDSMIVHRYVRAPLDRKSFFHNSAAIGVAFWQDQVAHILVIAFCAWLSGMI